VLQAADILVYKANAVPVGEDQLPHLELTREICRRFSNFYGNVFPEPQAILTTAPRVPGIDGRKMSKSYGNAIVLAEEPQDIEQKVKQMFTDPKKIRALDPGHPEGCVVYAFHTIYNPEVKVREKQCKAGEVGCVECKKLVAEMLKNALAPIREKRERLIREKGLVDDILNEGKKKAAQIAEQTMEEVRAAVKLK
jgi:tryptophanyl-tRNA synthetase